MGVADNVAGTVVDIVVAGGVAVGIVDADGVVGVVVVAVVVAVEAAVVVAVDIVVVGADGAMVVYFGLHDWIPIQKKSHPSPVPG
jgi:hypothetical protein